MQEPACARNVIQKTIFVKNLVESITNVHYIVKHSDNFYRIHILLLNKMLDLLCSLVAFTIFRFLNIRYVLLLYVLDKYVEKDKSIIYIFFQLLIIAIIA